MNTSLKDAVKEMMNVIAERIPNRYKKEPVHVYITGGIAIHFHTASRVSKDLDAIIDKNIAIPSKLKVIWVNEKGEFEELAYDHNYSPTLGIMHDAYEQRAIYQFTIDEKLKVYILDPVDLIISKLSRFGEQDQDDIKRIIQNDLVSKETLEVLAKDAIRVAGAGRPETLKIHLDLALEMFDA
ncbi:MAG: DUF6036 family nucleotidyltransferase [Sulfurospirillum sp.]